VQNLYMTSVNLGAGGDLCADLEQDKY
jgi:hypothetical protein